MAVIAKPAAVAEAGSKSLRAMRKLVSESKSASSPQTGTMETPPFQQQREQLRREINDNGIKRAPIGSQELPALEGTGSYAWQFYLRGPLLKARHLSFVARCFWSVYKDRYLQRPFQIAGVEAAAVPIMTAIILGAGIIGLELNAFTIRKERKTYGRRNLIEGCP